MLFNLSFFGTEVNIFENFYKYTFFYKHDDIYKIMAFF